MSNLVHLTRVSNNVKTGPIPVSTSSKDTCPSTCALKDNGCYASNFPLSLHWDKVTRGDRGLPWEEFLDEIRRLPKGQLWRHNQAGDLQGSDDVIDATALRQLVKANKGRRAFTYSHYPMTARNLRAVQAANKAGFTVNVSTDNLEEALRVAQLGVPVVTVVPVGFAGGGPGVPVTVCPAQRLEYMTCAQCQLCQKADRRAIVAFEAHGARVKAVERVINIRRAA